MARACCDVVQAACWAAWQVAHAALPTKTADDILRRFAAETTKALGTEDVRARLRQVGALATGGTPEQALRFHRAEYEKWGNVVRSTGAKPG